MSFLMWIRQIVMNERKLHPGSFHGKATRLWPAQSGKVTQSGMHSYFCENVGEKDFAGHVALVSCRVIDKKPHYYWPYSPAYNSNALHSMKTVPYYYNFIPPTPLFYSYIWFRMYNMYNCINLYVYTGPGATVWHCHTSRTGQVCVSPSGQLTMTSKYMPIGPNVPVMYMQIADCRNVYYSQNFSFSKPWLLGSSTPTPRCQGALFSERKVWKCFRCL